MPPGANRRLQRRGVPARRRLPLRARVVRGFHGPPRCLRRPPDAVRPRDPGARALPLPVPDELDFVRLPPTRARLSRSLGAVGAMAGPCAPTGAARRGGCRLAARPAPARDRLRALRGRPAPAGVPRRAPGLARPVRSRHPGALDAASAARCSRDLPGSRAALSHRRRGSELAAATARAPAPTADRSLVASNVIAREEVAAPRPYDGELTAPERRPPRPRRRTRCCSPTCSRACAGEDPRWRLVVCGDGPLEGELAERLRALGVAEHARAARLPAFDDGLLAALPRQPRLPARVLDGGVAAGALRGLCGRAAGRRDRGRRRAGGPRRLG